jgi:hypothetical protein
MINLIPLDKQVNIFETNQLDIFLESVSYHGLHRE